MRLGVSPGEVVQAEGCEDLERGLPSEGTVAAMVIVEVAEPEEPLDVAPARRSRASAHAHSWSRMRWEMFHLPIGLGTADPCLLRPPFRSQLRLGTRVRSGTGIVVGNHAPNLDSVVGVEVGGASPEGRRGQSILVVVDLGVDGAGTVVDGGVQVAVAGPE